MRVPGRFLLILIDYLAFIRGDRRVFELNEEVPSYSLHGSALRIKQNITVIGCAGCSFLIDYSTRFCAKEQEVDSYRDDDRRDRITCYDQLPFTLNRGQPDHRRCRKLDAVDLDGFEFVYRCYYEISTEKLFVAYQQPIVDDSFGISFRIKQFVDTNSSIFLVPASSDWEDGGVLDFVVDSSEMIMILPWANSPITMENYPYFTIQVVFYSDHEVVDTYYGYIYAGAAPGFNHTNLLSSLRYWETYIVDYFASVLTIVNPIEGMRTSVSLLFNVGRETSVNFVFLEEFFVTSINFPWILDETNEIDFCFEQAVLADNYDASSVFRLDVLQLIGGILEVDSYGNGRELKKYTISSIDYTESLLIEGAVLKFFFCPNNETEERKGFYLNGKVIAEMKPVKNVTCETSNLFIHLNDSSPVLVFYGPSLNYYDRFCLHVDEQDFLLEICDLEPIDSFPVHIDGDIRDLDCNKGYNFTTRVQYCCLLHYTARSEGSVLDFSGFRIGLETKIVMLRKIRETDENLDVIGLYNWDTLAIPQNHENDTVIVMVLAALINDDFEYLSLEYLRWSRNDANCIYDLFAGFAIPIDSGDPRRLISFSDERPFHSQRLPPQAYTIFIPRGCSPTISFKPIEAETQYLCDGVGLAIGPGYNDPFHSQILVDDNKYQNLWTCEASAVDLLIEVIDCLTGTLVMNILDKSKGIVQDGSIRITPETAIPVNYTFIGARSVQISWQSTVISTLGEPNGFFIRLNFKRPPPNNYTIFTTTTTTRPSSGIKRHNRIFNWFFQILLFYHLFINRL